MVSKALFRLYTDYQLFMQKCFRKDGENFRKMRSRPHRLRMPYRYLWGIFLFQFSPFGTKMVLKIAPGTKFGFCGPFRTASKKASQNFERLFCIHSLHSFSSLILFAHSLRSLSSRTLSTQIAFRWTSWKPCRFVHPDRFLVDKLNTALNHPINEYAELLSFFPSTFSTYSCFLCLWVSFMLNVFRK